MLTVGRIKEKEAALLSCFVGFHDALTALERQKAMGKKVIERLLDMNT